jgi:hypothetical protein
MELVRWRCPRRFGAAWKRVTVRRGKSRSMRVMFLASATDAQRDLKQGGSGAGRRTEPSLVEQVGSVLEDCRTYLSD